MAGFNVVVLAIKNETDGEDVLNGKFIQILHEEEGETVVFATESRCRYHAQILDAFCREYRAAWRFDLNHKGDNGVLQEAHARVLGGGLWRCYERERRLMLGGTSQAFGDFVAQDLPQKLAASGRFAGYCIEV